MKVSKIKVPLHYAYVMKQLACAAASQFANKIGFNLASSNRKKTLFEKYTQRTLL
jgi:hypothetical protein